MRGLPQGVCRTPISNRFFARVYIDGKARRLGTFDTPEQAHAAYRSAARKKLPCGVRCSEFSRDKYTAKLTYKGVRRWVGTFNSVEAAHAAYLAAKRELAELNKPKQV
ncbi:MAG: hypothetical protein BWK73_20065 [Thiothrix lacustris]|uniref:AP2/ERF domain-containing protein n=1 Tax=Thiothrix lacustris TaxID=525917 RepID=A0A1Y1QP56_9GAMM|nr:MAG: hypothetical protein BWK73_20065 [Thiothrix lacustris]